MRIEIKAWLYDILNAVNEIEGFLKDGPKDFDEYRLDIKTKRAVERNLEIIGEAMSRILKIDDTFKVSDSRKMVDLRNRVIHGYDSISDQAIWGILINQLPVLHREVARLIEE